MGRNGRAYVRKNYRWDVIMAKYERMFAKLRQGPSARRPLLAIRSRRRRSPSSTSVRVGPIGAGAADDRRLLAARPDVVALDHLVERRRLDVQQLRGALLHAAGGLERRLDQPLLEVGDHVLERDALGRHDELRHLEALAAADVVRDQVGVDLRVPVDSTTARSMTFSSSRTLPGQSYSMQQVQRLGRQLEVGLVVLLAVLLEEVLREQRNVVLALAQRRQLHGDDVQPVEQVLAELAFVHHVPQVDVGRGDDPHVDLDRLDAAEAHELALLDDAQQLGLRLERDVADLVEEDRALVGELEQPLLRVDGAGERALDVAEQVRLEQVGRQVAGVDGDERAIRARGVLVQRRARPAPCRCRSRR